MLKRSSRYVKDKVGVMFMGVTQYMVTVMVLVGVQVKVQLIFNIC